ncbi:MAG: hypothetical protein HYW28_11110 [Rhodospirillales bacterium]|nr:hypothetical protein [Rhodospirillales bacterium]
MCEGLSFLDLEARVGCIYGVPKKKRTLLTDPRVVDLLKSRDLSPWDAIKQMLRWLILPAGRAL